MITEKLAPVVDRTMLTPSIQFYFTSAIILITYFSKLVKLIHHIRWAIWCTTIKFQNFFKLKIVISRVEHKYWCLDVRVGVLWN